MKQLDLFCSSSDISIAVCPCCGRYYIKRQEGEQVWFADLVWDGSSAPLWHWQKLVYRPFVMSEEEANKIYKKMAGSDLDAVVKI